MLKFKKMINILIASVLASTTVISASSSFDDKKFPSDYVARFTQLAGSALLNSSKNQNIVFAPLNIFHSVSILHLGSVNETRKELSDIFGLPEDPNDALKFHRIFGNLLRMLEVSENITLKPAVRAYLHEFIPPNLINQTFVEQIKTIYNVELERINFQKTFSYKPINNWISQQTNGHIPEFFLEPINPDTKLLIISALYFAADWRFGFKKETTKKEDFYTRDSTIQVDMMNTIQDFEYLDDPKYPFRILGLPYKNQNFSFYVQLPREEPSSPNFKIDFDAVYLSVLEGLQTTKTRLVHVKLPRLSIASQSNFESVFNALGSRHIIKEPKLNGIFDKTIDELNVNHAATVDIDENGTTATAITSIGIIIKAYSPPREEIKFHINKPFSFCIYHKPLKTILFAGVISKI